MNKTAFFIAALVLFLGSTNRGIAQVVAAPAGFWDNANISFGAGIQNFHGDFDGPRIQSGGQPDAPVGIPFAPNGTHLMFRIDKQLPWPKVPEYRLKARAGFDFIDYKSPTADRLLRQGTGAPSFQSINVINQAFGVGAGVGFEYLINDNNSIEPRLDVKVFYHNPTTDGFYRTSGNDPSQPQIANATSQQLNYVLRDEIRSRYVVGNDGQEPYGPFIAQANLGFRYSHTFIGNYRWFVDYGVGFFFNDYFDNTSQINSAANSGQNDMMTSLVFGMQYPLSVEKRVTQQVEKKQVRIDRKKIAKIERIQNIANLITTDEDLLELQKILADKILLYDTPGVRFNELAAKCIERKIPLGDSQIMTDMIEVPGGSYIIGLTAVDELEVQVQGRKRITINPFLVDKYEVTNEQYRTFLIAMKALPAPLPVNPADTLIAKFNYGSTIEWQELVRRSALNDYANHARPPQLNGPGDLMPADSMWIKYGLNDVIPWDTYFYDPYYDNYPVVCVNWYQARLFAAWSGKRLPTESEWEYVSRSGVSGRVYPWDGLDVQTKTGKFRGNFKQSRGVYDEDGYAIMAPVDSYLPNDFGLYNTSGNISEWVLDAWNPSYVVLQNVGTSNFVSPYYANDQEPRKIHRGGSWQSTKFYIGVGVRNFQDKNQGSPFVGFRCAKSMTRTYR